MRLRRISPRLALLAAAGFAFAQPARATATEALQSKLEARFKGDRTRACVVAALIARWKDLAGEYALTPQFKLQVFEEAGVLKVRGSGQSAIPAELTGTDTLALKAVGAIVEFKRDANGKVGSAVLKQGGQVIEGPRSVAAE